MNTAHFFYRNVIFSKANNQVSLVNFDNPEKDREVLEPWFGMVLMLADGQHTIKELVEMLATKYDGAAPPNLEQTIHSAIQRLAESKFIVLTEKKTDLPYYLSLPYERLDIEKAKELYKKDKANMAEKK